MRTGIAPDLAMSFNVYYNTFIWMDKDTTLYGKYMIMFLSQ